MRLRKITLLIHYFLNILTLLDIFNREMWDMWQTSKLGLWALAEVNLIYTDILDFIGRRLQQHPGGRVRQAAHRKNPNLMRALTRASPRSSTTGRRCVCVSLCVSVCAWAYFVFAHTAERSRKLCTRVPGVGVGLLRWEKPCSLKDSRDQLFSPEQWCVTM